MSPAAEDFEDALVEARGSVDRLSRRLRGLSPLAWRSRRTTVEVGLQRLDELGASAENTPAHVLPAIPEFALADALDVIANDALVAIAELQDVDALNQVRDELAALLDATL